MNGRHRWGVVMLGTCVFGVLAARVPVAQQALADVETPPEITIQTTPPGDMFADVDGYALYVSERDAEPGTSSCYDSCASEWIPVRASADAEPFGDWTLVPRDDGMPQWAYQGRPLYRWASETQRRWADGQNQSWRYALVSPFPARIPPRRGLAAIIAAATAAGVDAAAAAQLAARYSGRGAPPAPVSLPPDVPGGITGQPSALGPVFADGKGLTLYTSTASTPCAGQCVAVWKPLPAPLLATDAAGDWTIVSRPDGSLQWAYQGEPLYRSVKDAKAGDANGESDEWHAVLVPGVAAAAPAP